MSEKRPIVEVIDVEMESPVSEKSEVREGGNLEEDREGVGLSVNSEIADIRRLLECPVCYEVILPPLILCVAGHSVCNLCRNNLDTCPCCRGEFTTTRNLFAERFLEMCVIDCWYDESGCRVALPAMEISRHVPTCNYRPLMCQGCEQPIPCHEFLGHLKKVEKLEILRGTNCTGGFYIREDDLNKPFEEEDNPAWEPIWVRAYGHDFFCFLDKLENGWVLWVGVYGVAPDDCSKFITSIKAYHRKTKHAEKYYGPPHSIRASPQDLRERGQCLSLQTVQLRELLYNEGLDINIQIDVEKTLPGEVAA